jgi:hypothetical protein
MAYLESLELLQGSDYSVVMSLPCWGWENLEAEEADGAGSWGLGCHHEHLGLPGVLILKQRHDVVGYKIWRVIFILCREWVETHWGGDCWKSN